MLRPAIGASLLAAIVAATLAFHAGRAPASAPKQWLTASYLQTAEQGLALVRKHWWNADAAWYDDTYNGQPPLMLLARLWSAYPLFETYVALALADPTPAKKPRSWRCSPTRPPTCTGTRTSSRTAVTATTRTRAAR